MNSVIQQKRSNNLTLKETFEIKNPKLQNALKKILPDSDFVKKLKKNNKKKEKDIFILTKKKQK